jgi:pilus assembly protein Flp/PilA
MLTLLAKTYGLRKEIARRLSDEERGQTLIEYALIATLVAIAAILILFAVGLDLNETFDSVENALGVGGNEAITSTPGGDDDLTPTIN